MCNVAACPIHCEVGEWTEWTPCSATCDTGMQIRTRDILMFPQNSGDKCPPTKETQDCNDIGCDIARLKWKCEREKWPRHFTPSRCSPDYVYCPGWFQEGEIGHCPDYKIFDIWKKSCVPENHCNRGRRQWSNEPWEGNMNTDDWKDWNSNPGWKHKKPWRPDWIPEHDWNPPVWKPRVPYWKVSDPIWRPSAHWGQKIPVWKTPVWGKPAAWGKPPQWNPKPWSPPLNKPWSPPLNKPWAAKQSVKGV